MQISWYKERLYKRKEFNPNRTFLENQLGRPFIVLYTNMTVVTLCRNDLLLMLFEERSLLVSLCLHWVFLKGNFKV